MRIESWASSPSMAFLRFYNKIQTLQQSRKKNKDLLDYVISFALDFISSSATCYKDAQITVQLGYIILSTYHMSSSW